MPSRALCDNRNWQAVGLQLPRRKHLKPSTDPFFVENGPQYPQAVPKPSRERHRACPATSEDMTNEKHLSKRFRGAMLLV
jgi:hypothetical protein